MGLSLRFAHQLTLRIIALAAIGTLAAQDTHAMRVGKCDLQDLKERIQQNAFKTNRGAKAYGRFLGFDLVKRVQDIAARATPEEPAIWLDIGPGGARAAADVRAHLRGSPVENNLRIVGVAITAPMPLEDIYRVFKQSGPTDAFRYDLGAYESIQTIAPGTVTLITDVFAAHTYSTEIAAVINRDLELLKVGGRLETFIPAGSLRIENASGKKIPIPEWLKTIEGVELAEPELFVSDDGRAQYRLSLVKKSTQARIPPITFDRVHAPRTVPSRLFKAGPELANLPTSDVPDAGDAIYWLASDPEWILTPSRVVSAIQRGTAAFHFELMHELDVHPELEFNARVEKDTAYSDLIANFVAFPETRPLAIKYLSERGRHLSPRGRSVFWARSRPTHPRISAFGSGSFTSSAVGSRCLRS